MTMQLPKGYLYGGVSAGIKTRAGARDVGLVLAQQECTMAGVFTTNAIVAAPVVLSRRVVPSGRGRGVIINSGNANACTGEQGDSDAAEMARLAAEAAARAIGSSVSADQLCVMSTGIIGRVLPMDKIRSGIHLVAEQLGDDQQHFLAASDAIMTTDATRKIAGRSFRCGDSDRSLAAMAKGAGMIGPSMATMLAIVTTDVPLTPLAAARALQRAVDRSFNCVSVEGHMSTNDSVVLLAAASDATDNQVESDFTEVLTDGLIELAKMIPADGEGSTHLIEIVVDGARSDGDADRIARTVASSNLVKTAVYGNDPNWGRIVSAAGYAGVRLDPLATDLHVNGHLLFRGGQPVAFDAKTVSESIRDHATTRIELTVGRGGGSATHWTSDLGTAYVQFNSDYST